MQMLWPIGKMNPNFLIVFAYVWYIVASANASDISFSQDTYADALHNSHKTDFDATGGGYDYNPPKDISYLPPATSPPAPAYGPPPDINGGGYDYNPPKDNSYLPPAPSPPVYGPPPIYNYPQASFYKPAHPIPYHSHDSFWPN